MNILGIDPGPFESAYCVIDPPTCRPIRYGKVANAELIHDLWALDEPIRAHIEMIASYGMAVGAEVFETCVWIGRFYEALAAGGREPERVKRGPIKLHLCHSSQAKDGNVIQALVDRFAFGQPNKGKGTKDAPGWFYGFSGDVWQAYAVAVYAADTITAVAA